MKTMKKLFALLLALTMVFGLAVTAFAAAGSGPRADQKGKIMIQNPAPSTTYKAYKMLELKSWRDDENVDPEGEPDGTADAHGNYSYWIDQESAWYAFFTGEGYAASYFEVDADGYVSMKETLGNGTPTFSAETLAKEALKYAETHAPAISPDAGRITDEDQASTGAIELWKCTNGVIPTTGENTNLDLGYYLVDTTMGALCSLGTTDNVAEIKEKNELPPIEKEVENNDTNYTDPDTSETRPNDANDVSVGDTVNYKVTITIKNGASNYIIHDTMDKGLTFGVITSVQYFKKDQTTGTDIDDVSPTVEPEEPSEPDGNDVVDESEEEEETAEAPGYILTAPAQHDGNVTHTFDMQFTNALLDTLEEGDTIVVKYTATLNDKAVVGVEAGGNKNDVMLQYGDDNYTEKSTTRTYTFDFNVFKFFTKPGEGDSGATQVALDGATFKLSDSETLGENAKTYEFVKYVPTSETPSTKENPVEEYYRVCSQGSACNIADHKDGENSKHVSEITTNGSGKFNIDGLDAGTYYLHETKAPDGFNAIKHPIKIEIDHDGKVSYYSPVYKDSKWVYEENPDNYGDEGAGVIANATVNVENKSGTELPSTGGMGTTLFYVVGSLMVLGAAVLLVAKKRSNT